MATPIAASSTASAVTIALTTCSHTFRCRTSRSFRTMADGTLALMLDVFMSLFQTWQ
jgi:hypothetical protein